MITSVLKTENFRVPLSPPKTIEGKMRTAVFDLDGTLADHNHRLHFLNGDVKDYKSYYEASVNDEVIEPMALLCDILWDADDCVILATGRPEKYRQITEEWLFNNNIAYERLYMRADTDFRRNPEVKYDMLRLMRREKYEPWVAFEDNARTAQMWRENGVHCLLTEDLTPA